MSRALHFSRDPLTMTAEEVWAEIHAQETDEDRAQMKKNMEDVAAGRFYSLRDGKFVPNPDWPEDGVQPTGKHPE